MNFALMFALALGIDYALFIVVRFRGALFGRGLTPVDAAGDAMDTAGKAVLFSGMTVLISLSAVMLVPSPAFRSMALGIMISVVFVLAATLTLLPAVLGELGPRVDNLALPWAHSGEHRSPRFAALGRAPLARAAALRRPRPARAARARRARARPEDRHAVDQGRPDRRQLPRRLHAGPGRRSAPAPRRAAAGRPRPRRRARSPRSQRPTPASRASCRPSPTRRQLALVQAIPRRTRRPAVGTTIDRLRAALPAGRSSAAPRPRTTTSSGARQRTPLVIGVVLALGFLLLLIALQAPVIAARRRAHEPARHRRSFRGRPADLPGRPPLRPARLRVAGLPRRLGAGLLLRDDLRDLDGLHRLPALLRQGALGARTATRTRRWSAASPTPAASSSPPGR